MRKKVESYNIIFVVVLTCNLACGRR